MRVLILYVGLEVTVTLWSKLVTFEARVFKEIARVLLASLAVNASKASVVRRARIKACALAENVFVLQDG